MAACPIKRIPADSRVVTFPIGRPAFWAYYERARDSYWTPAEIDFSKDYDHYERKLTPGQRRFVDHILAFFASGDKLVNVNLAERFKREVPILEVEYFYDMQMAIENIHAETYALQLDTIISDISRREQLFNALDEMPVVKRLADYIRSCTESSEPFAVRVLRMACVEGVFFSGCFCAIYWLQNRGLMPGLGQANEMISRDEGLHTEFALCLYNETEERASTTQVYDIFREAVGIAREFIVSSMPEPLPEMNAALMTQYIEYVADNLLDRIHVPRLYNRSNPFPFMKQLNLENRTNFFERRPTEYGKAKKSTNWVASNDF